MKAALLRPALARVAALILCLVAIVVVGLVLYFGTPSGAVMLEAKAALVSDNVVHVSRGRWIVFAPASKTVTSGVIFYPGGRVAPEAYAPLARTLAESGSLAVIVPMPLNLAVLDADAATAVIVAYPQVATWVIAGHSLGGSMAARYAHDNPERVDGLVMLAAYPEAHLDFRDQALAVATVYGDRDGLATLEEVENSFLQLPTDAMKILIKGGNHAGFGWYGEQEGDHPAQISRDVQQEQVISAFLSLMREAGK
ncbi:MAG: alpha/beta fold hydrolase [Chloroflexi bacterium]|nr:alpha/beta fold hydrolase [Chloroflexota bacterium]